MKNLKLPQILLLAVGVLAAFAAAAGVPIISPEMFAAFGLVPLALCETSIADLSDLIKKQGEAWNEFKHTNDQRIKALEEKGHVPADLEAKLKSINTDMTQLAADIAEVAKKSARPVDPGNTKGLTPEQLEHKQAFSTFLRKGRSDQLSELEKKAMGRGSDVDGGYLVTTELASEIDRIASTVSVVRSVADVRTIGSSAMAFRVKTQGLGATWVGEGETAGESSGNKFSRIEIDAEELEAEPWVYNDTLEDADLDLEMDLANEAGIAFGEAEGAAFVTGDGVKKPRGFLSYDTVANASYAWGKVGYVASGASGDFAATNPADKIITLLHSLKQTYRNGAALMMADSTLAVLRTIKDGSGNFYLFNPDPTGEFSGLVLGKPVIIDDNMPAIGANSYSIAYANWQRAYRIVDRRGMSLIRDNITAKGTTKFNFRKRVGGGIRNFEAIKLMKFAAS